MKNSLVDLSSLNLKAPLISVFNLKQFEEIAGGVSLKKSERFIVDAVIEMLNTDPREYISISEICAHTGKKDTTVRQYLNALFDHGLFTLEFCNVSKGLVRRSKIYAFNESTLQCDKLSTSSDVSSNELEAINQSYIGKGAELHGKLDSLITYYLFQALQFNRKGKLTKNIVNSYLNDNDMLQITAVSKSDNIVAYVKDLRIYLAILKLIHDVIVNRISLNKQALIPFERVISTEFDIRGVDILVTMGQGGGSGERNNLNASMLRLDGTSYVIRAPNWFTHKHNLSSGNSRVDHFRIRFDAETQGKGLIYKLEIQQSIVRQIYQEIVDGSSMLSFTDPQLFAVKNDFSFAFLLSCQRLKPGKVTQLTWSEMKDMFAAGLPIKEFKTSLTKMLQKNIVVDPEDGSQLWVVNSRSNVVVSCECLYNNVSVTLDEGVFHINRTPSDIVLANTLSKRTAQSFRKEIS